MATANPFTDEEIAKILELINDTRHTQYIGARYVPIFGRKNETTIEWDNKGAYEPLTIVLHDGNSYTSRQYVPAGIDITNTEFWANTGNYNAQIEQYRAEVQTVRSLAETNEKDIATVEDDITEIDATRAIVYDTVADMTSATIPQNAKALRTLGYYTKGDDGAAYYMIGTNTNDIRSIKLKDNRYAINLDTTGNIAKYGGKPNDNTFDNATIINNVLTALNKAYIPKNIWYIGTSIILNDERQILRGDSKTASIIRGIPALTAPLIRNYENSISMCLVQNLTFDGQATAYTECLAKFNNGLYITVDNCNFTAIRGATNAHIKAGLKESDYTGTLNVFKLANSRLQLCALTTASPDSVIINNEIWASNITDLECSINVMTNATNTLIEGNMIAGTSNLGCIMMKGRGSRIINNYFDGGTINLDNKNGINVDSASNLLIANNLFWHIKRAPITCTRINNSSIVGNTFQECDYWQTKVPDIHIDGGTDKVAFGNIIEANIHYSHHGANADHTEEEIRNKDNNRNVYDLESNPERSATVITGNQMEHPDYYTQTIGHSGLYVSQNNGNIKFSPQNNSGMKTNPDAGVIYRNNGHFWITSPNGVAIDLGAEPSA